ncbi:DNA integrity scanning protein DisA nucleotide-binding domain protein [Oscillospiraceae bacterium OttesenSCG-928-G22]|nr:DNA integrity scanning protein DisA nucleotide-binding domain protein [Oscillospiraceae bacterium OttesenSCG-928-G22]
MSGMLLKNIFFPNAALHDGAVIIRQGRLVAAGCMLPLTNNTNLSRDLGMRHRAGVGVSEQSDAVSIIVSEEMGAVSVAVGGILKLHLSPDTLLKLLQNELLPNEESQKKESFIKRIFRRLRGKKNDKG